MNVKQMAILTATVVALVVVVTLMKVGLGGRAGDTGSVGEPVHLTDPHLKFDATGGPASRFSRKLPPDQEMGSEGHYDFRFTNDKDAPVDVFVTRVSCNRCLRVQIGLAPDGGQAGEKAPPPGPEVAWERLETEEVKSNARGFTVPPKRSGWVRLTWKDEEAGVKILSADLRTTSRVGTAPHVLLQYAGYFVEPVRVVPEKKELSVDTLFATDEKPHTAWFTVYSSTRAAFTLVPEDADKQKGHPFITCGQPVALTDEECRAEEKKHQHAFLCGYKVPVTVWERLKDGRQHDLGLFRTGVTLKSDVLADDLALYVFGTVRGDVKVIGDENVEDHVVFGNFPRGSDRVKEVTVETPPGTTLRIDRKPDFMEAEVKDESDGAGKTWRLTVTIRANGVNGHFPQPDDPSLKDTAIYLKANERMLRIPVSGTASQR